MAKARAVSKRGAPSRERRGGTGFLKSLGQTLSRIQDSLARANDVTSVLVVEDDKDARDILTTLLTHAGYMTVGVSNGREALGTLKRVIPSLIILDLRMPEMDGWALHRALKADPVLCQIPVVVVSAFANMASGQTGVQAEAWFQKPIDLDAFLLELPRIAVRG
jgi:CheY-like chemotaxis protein